MIEKEGIINFSSYRNRSYAFVVFNDSEDAFLVEGRILYFVHFSLVFCL